MKMHFSKNSPSDFEPKAQTRDKIGDRLQINEAK